MKVFVATSKRFYAEAAVLCDDIRAAGHMVYHPFFDRDQDSIEADPALKQAVTRDHFAEIDACDVLYALAPGGYVGTSVVIEMAYAFARGNRVVTSEPVGEYAARALVSEVAAPADFLGALRVACRRELFPAGAVREIRVEEGAAVQEGETVTGLD